MRPRTAELAKNTFAALANPVSPVIGCNKSF